MRRATRAMRLKGGQLTAVRVRRVLILLGALGRAERREGKMRAEREQELARLIPEMGGPAKNPSEVPPISGIL